MMLYYAGKNVVQDAGGDGVGGEGGGGGGVSGGGGSGGGGSGGGNGFVLPILEPKKTQLTQATSFADGNSLNP